MTDALHDQTGATMSQPHQLNRENMFADWRMSRLLAVIIALPLLLWLFAVALAQESRFEQTHSRSQYVHWIDLYDANDAKIDPADPDAPPYSPAVTCGKCHDYQAIAHGYHFNAMTGQYGSGPPGEPWVWTDTRTGTQIPLSYRGWEGTYDPRGLGITAWDFLLQFGRQLPGGGPGEYSPSSDAEQPSPEAADKEKNVDTGRWKLSGRLDVDCMICHSDDRSHSLETWWEQITEQNFAWAATAALGLAKIDGAVKSLPDDFDPSAAAEKSSSGPRLPRTVYNQNRFNADKKVLFDIVRKPSNDACYYCHTTRPVGEGAPPQWTRDEDVHVRAGLSCADCHRNGIDHHTVRGFEGEKHPSGESVSTLSCRGCHMGDSSGSNEGPGGRLGAPKPLHKGLPVIHLEKMACTSCHSGPPPAAEARRIQTAMAHGLGLPSHEYEAEKPPGVAAPVLQPEDDMLYPHRMMWPAFWGAVKGENATPLHPDIVYDALRLTLRVRRGGDFTEALTDVRLSKKEKVQTLGVERAAVEESELAEEEQAKLARFGFEKKLVEALESLKKVIKEDGAAPFYVSGGKGYRLSGDGKLEPFAHAAAKPYAWRLAHDVRPARWSIGAKGCFECHSAGAPYFEGLVEAIGPAPDAEPITKVMYELQGADKTKIDAWNRSFQGRTAFKWVGFVCMGAVGLILLSYLLVGVNGLFGLARRRQ